MPSAPSDEPGLQADQLLVDRGWLRIGAGAAVAAQAMVFSLAANLSEISGPAYAVVHGILIASAVLAFAFLGRDLAASAWTAVRERRISVDLLFLVTLLGAFAGSIVSTFTRTGSVYYEVVAILIVVHTTGRLLGARSRVAALRTAEEKAAEFEFCEVVLDDGSLFRRKAREVPAGARVRVEPGGAVPVDGVIADGRGYIQETAMTGEWHPVARGPGDRVLAGTHSVDGRLVIVADGGSRRFDAVVDTVRTAGLAPSLLQQQADRLTSWFLPVVIAVSAGTFLFWWRVGPWDRALFNSMAVLLVACPCAMGLATPVAVWSGLARLADFGLVARTGDLIDLLAGAEVLLVDKTGTLSESALVVREWREEPAQAVNREWLRAAVRCAEAGLAHPVARALAEEELASRGPALLVLQLESRRLVPALGIVAVVRTPGGERHEIAVGEWALKVAGGSAPGTARTAGSDDGRTVEVFVDGGHAATLVLAERWRRGLSECLGELRGLGLQVEVLSGDPLAEAALGGLAPVRAGLSPLEKHDRVVELQARGRTVLYVGDGVNDAAAMSAADGAIVMRGGSDLARASSLAVFAGDDLRFLPAAVRYGRRVRRALRVNLYFAAGYNAAGMALAAAGLLHPVAAALLMLGSSLFVSVFALRETGRTGIKAAGR